MQIYIYFPKSQPSVGISFRVFAVRNRKSKGVPYGTPSIHHVDVVLLLGPQVAPCAAAFVGTGSTGVVVTAFGNEVACAHYLFAFEQYLYGFGLDIGFLIHSSKSFLSDNLFTINNIHLSSLHGGHLASHEVVDDSRFLIPDF